MSEITTPPPTVVGGDNDKIFNISSTKLILNEIKSDIIDTNLNKFTLSKSKPPTRFKFLWVGTSHKQFTGYSRVSYAIMTELSKTIGKLPGVEIHHFAF
jgi:glycosyltransferase involved in cell wall biosynthesis